MKIQYMSDLHLEHHPIDKAPHILHQLNVDNPDVLIVAGDFTSARRLPRDLKTLHDIFFNVPHILYITGNHEYYGADRRELDTYLESLEHRPEFSRLEYLNCTTIDIGGVKFGGANLWFRLNPKNISYGKTVMSDFGHIHDFEKWVDGEAEKAALFFKNTQLDVAISHYMPSYQCVQPPYIGERSNIFYVNQILEDLDTPPPIWIHGHTHTPYTKTINGTKVYCNPSGYPFEGYKINPEFFEIDTSNTNPRNSTG
jgi:predicted phosphodiesterase